MAGFGGAYPQFICDALLKFEQRSGGPRFNVASVISALEKAGVEFIPEYGLGAGVRLSAALMTITGVDDDIVAIHAAIREERRQDRQPAFPATATYCESADCAFARARRAGIPPVDLAARHLAVAVFFSR